MIINKKIKTGLITSLFVISGVLMTNNVKAEDMETGVLTQMQQHSNQYVTTAQDYLNSLNLDTYTKGIFEVDVTEDKANLHFNSMIDVETWKQNVNEYIAKNKADIDWRISQEKYIKAQNHPKEEETRMISQLKNGLSGMGGQSSVATAHKTMSLWMGGGYANISMHLHHRGDVVVNIASSKESGGGNLWSGPHGHFYEGHVNSVGNPVLTVSWINQINDITPISLSWKEGWRSGSVIYGRGSVYNYGLGHEGIDVGYGGNTRLAVPEDVWVGQMNLNGNLKQVVFVDPSEANKQHPFYYGISHATYVPNGGKSIAQSNQAIVTTNIGANSIPVYASCGLSYRTTYISPNSFYESNVSVIPNVPALINRKNGCSQIQYVSPNGYTLGGYITNSDYDRLNYNSRKVSFDEYFQIIKSIRSGATNHTSYDRSKGIYEFSPNERRNDSSAVVSSGWKQNSYGWQYINSNLTQAKGFKFIDNKWYYFNNNGYLVKNKWINEDNVWYYINSNWVMVTNIQNIDGKKYFFTTNGKLNTNKWISYNNYWYYAYEKGDLAIGIRQVNQKVYSFNSNGIMISNKWVKNANNWYYASWTGELLKGLISYEGRNYYLDNNNGALFENKWFKLGNNWYFANVGGSLSVGFQIINQKQYYFDSNCIMYSSKWINVGDNWYYTNADGSLATGFKTINYRKYYFDSNFAMNKNNWFKVGTNWYHANSEGNLSVGFQTINGYLYWFDSNAVMYENKWFQVDSRWYYAKNDGVVKV